MAVKRRYDSARRQEQARQTRRAILDAAGRLFVDPGYAATPLTAVAAEAGVAVQTVYAVFGSKRQLLSDLVDVTLAGDDEPVALPDRRSSPRSARWPTRGRSSTRYARHLAEIHARQAQVMLALAGAATADADAAAIWRKNVDDRRRGMAMFAAELVATGGYAPTWTSTRRPTCCGWPRTSATTTGSSGSAAGPSSVPAVVRRHRHRRRAVQRSTWVKSHACGGRATRCAGGSGSSSGSPRHREMTTMPVVGGGEHLAGHVQRMTSTAGTHPRTPRPATRSNVRGIGPHLPHPHDHVCRTLHARPASAASPSRPADRAGSAATPAATRCEPSAATIAPLSVHSFGRGHPHA